MTHTYTYTRPLGLRRTDKSRAVLPVALTGAVPAHPLVADHLAAVPAWNGETNLRYGTCGPVFCANSAIMTWQYLLGTAVTVSDEAIFDLYRRSGNPDFDPDGPLGPDGYVPGDNGVDMTVMLAELVRGGLELTGPDGGRQLTKPLCFGRVLFPPYDDVHAVTAIFGGAGLALDLDAAQQAQTDTGLWDYAEGSPPWGGHATLGGAYTSAAGAHERDEALVTWMQVVGTTPGFLNHQLTELYVIVWQPLWDHPAFVAGVDRAVLAADYTAVTGRPFPITPPPTPPPGGAQDTLIGVLEARNARGQRWVDQRHFGYVTRVANAGRAWLASLGR